MAGFDTTAASAILKNVYLPPVRELLNNATPLLKFLEKKIQTLPGGTNFTIPVHVSRNSAAAMGVAEDGTLPTAGKQGYTTAIVPSKYLYSRIRVSGPAIAATQSDKGSFLRAVESEMKGLTRDTKREFNRQLNGDGRGALATLVAIVGDPTNIVDDGLGNPGADLLPTGALDVDIINGTTFANRQTDWNVTRGAVVATGRNMTRNSGTTTSVANADYVVRHGSNGNEMTGIRATISALNPPKLTGGLHGLTVAAQPDWTAQIIYATGTSEAATAAGRADLSFKDMQSVFSAIAANSDFSEADIKLILCSFGMRDKYVELCQNERRFYNVMKLDGGFEAVSYNGKPIVPDAQAAWNRMSFIVPESMAIYRLADLDWMDKDGSVFYRISGGDVDAYGATMFAYQELGCEVRNANGALLNVIQ